MLLVIACSHIAQPQQPCCCCSFKSCKLNKLATKRDASANSYTKYVRTANKQADKPDRSEMCRQARSKQTCKPYRSAKLVKCKQASRSKQTIQIEADEPDRIH